MNDILNKAIVLVLNRNWQAINISTPAEAFCQMATNVATALEIDGETHPSSVAPLRGVSIGSNIPVGDDKRTTTEELRRVDIRPVMWDEWITLAIRDGDNA